MSRIIDIKTEHSYEFKILFEVLKEILHEVNIEFIRDHVDNSPNTESKNNKKKSKNVSDEENEIKIKKKKTKDSSDDSDTDSSSNNSDSESEKESDSSESSDSKSEIETKKKTLGGIKILALDEYQTLLIYVKLNSDKFALYNVKPKCHSIGLNLLEFHKFMKTVDKECIMRMYIDKDDEQNIVFELENSVKHSGSSYSQKLLDIDDNNKKLPSETSFDMSVVIDTAEFKKTCTEMYQFSEYVEITCTNKEIIFKCQGDSNKYSKTFKNSDDGVRIIVMKNNGKGPNIVQAIYDLKHLVIFGKCTNLCNEIQLFLKNDYPLFIHYTIGSLGKMLVGLTPVDENKIKKDNDYDESLDRFYPNKKIVMKEM